MRGNFRNFLGNYENLTQLLTDHKLAALGDTFINFIYSLALSNRNGKAQGVRVKGRELAEALRKAGLRKYMPSRVSRHMLSDAAEALVVYAWVEKHIKLEECVSILEKNEPAVNGLEQLLLAVKERVNF